MLEIVEILCCTMTFSDSLEDLQHPLGADAAWRALPARLILGEIQVELRDIHHAVIFIHNDHAAGAHHGANGFEAVIIDWGIQICRGNDAAGRSAGLDGFEGLVVLNAAANFIDDFSKRDAHRHFHKTDVIDFPRKSEDLGAFRFFSANF